MLSEKLEATYSFDVVIIGAGPAGLNSAYRLKTQLPGLTFTVLEGRDDIGGTWDLFRYPGIRSDSDLYTYGFTWHPWPFAKPIAEGHLIKSYLKDSVSRHGLSDSIHLHHKVIAADWSSKSQRWHLVVNHDGETKRFQARFIVLGAGYFDYQSPMKVEIPGLEGFAGKVIHPQFWPADYDYSGKKIAIIGSGSTATTLLPALAEKAARVTMVQRSPSYILRVMGRSGRSSWVWNYLSSSFRSFYQRLRHALMQALFVAFCHYFPARARDVMRKLTVSQLPEWIDYDRHFSPRYNPWEQRMCWDVNGSFFEALRTGKAGVATGRIETVTDGGIRMEDGSTVDADVIVTATGINMKIGADIDLRVDGERVVWGEKLAWNVTMIEGVPNMGFMFGYTNAAWTLGIDNAITILIRLIKFMERNGYASVVPRVPKEVKADTVRLFQLTSTSATRHEDTILPRGVERIFLGQQSQPDAPESPDGEHGRGAALGVVASNAPVRLVHDEPPAARPVLRSPGRLRERREVAEQARVPPDATPRKSGMTSSSARKYEPKARPCSRRTRAT
ncbi:hypothetical protein DL762_010263 [Monosporascus cannonballus]|uniref:FAD/NAD(P)-binding domain-containing protein n=1 Tax=Monosporascus cannonballus TaxID=155416 RepID=A0ABY0GR20_9PEZI|nr:hypothetical protein DL762_010263 [Monosporascus cannonballus]